MNTKGIASSLDLGHSKNEFTKVLPHGQVLTTERKKRGPGGQVKSAARWQCLIAKAYPIVYDTTSWRKPEQQQGLGSLQPCYALCDLPACNTIASSQRPSLAAGLDRLYCRSLRGTGVVMERRSSGAGVLHKHLSSNAEQVLCNGAGSCGKRARAVEAASAERSAEGMPRPGRTADGSPAGSQALRCERVARSRLSFGDELEEGQDGPGIAASTAKRCASLLAKSLHDRSSTH